MHILAAGRSSIDASHGECQQATQGFTTWARLSSTKEASVHSCILLQRHAAVMGPTWGVLIPATILMARLRHKKGLWFKLHQALAVLSLTSVVVGAFLGRQLSYSHPPVTLSAKVHKVLGYTVTSFVVAQVRSRVTGAASWPSACICNITTEL